MEDVSNFKYQVGSAYDDCKPIKANNIKQGKDNYHMAIVGEVLSNMYPHPNFTNIGHYDDFMTKAVRKYQAELGHDVTGIITVEELEQLGRESGKFRLV